MRTFAFAGLPSGAADCSEGLSPVGGGGAACGTPCGTDGSMMNVCCLMATISSPALQGLLPLNAPSVKITLISP